MGRDGREKVDEVGKWAHGWERWRNRQKKHAATLVFSQESPTFAPPLEFGGSIIYAHRLTSNLDDAYNPAAHPQRKSHQDSGE